jgi:hypothetical protein
MVSLRIIATESLRTIHTLKLTEVFVTNTNDSKQKRMLETQLVR